MQRTSFDRFALAVLLLTLFARTPCEEKIYEVVVPGTLGNTTYIVTAQNLGGLLDGYELSIQQRGWWNKTAFLRFEGEDDDDFMELKKINEALETSGLGQSIVIEEQSQWEKRIRSTADFVTVDQLQASISTLVDRGDIVWETCNGVRSLSPINGEVTSLVEVEVGDSDVSDPEGKGGKIETYQNSAGITVHKIIVDNVHGGGGPAGIPTALDCALRLVTLMHSDAQLRGNFVVNITGNDNVPPDIATQIVQEYRNTLATELADLNKSISAGMIIGIQFIPGIGQGAALAIVFDDLENGNYAEAALGMFPAAIGALSKAGKLGKVILQSSATGKIVQFTADQARAIAGVMSGGGSFVDKVRSLTKICDVQSLPLFLSKFFCFPAGTQIHTPTGLVAIETLKAGDTIWGYDEIAKKAYPAEIEGSRSFYSTEQIRITVRGSAPGDTHVVETTPDHPFLIASEYAPDETWVPAGDVQVGDRIIAKQGSGEVVDLQKVFSTTQVYSLSLRSLFAYYVGDLGLVVHNHKCYAQFANEFRGLFGGKFGRMFAASSSDAGLADDALKALRALAAQKKGEDAIKAALRRSVGFGTHHHEWIPLENYKKMLDLPYSQQEREVLMGLWAQLRSHNSKIKFTKKGDGSGHVASGFSNTANSKEFHDGLTALFESSLKPGSANKAGVRAFMDKARDHAKKFMNDDTVFELFGPRVKGPGDMANAAKHTFETEKKVKNGGKYYGLFYMAEKVTDNAVEALEGAGFRP